MISIQGNMAVLLNTQSGVREIGRLNLGYTTKQRQMMQVVVLPLSSEPRHKLYAFSTSICINT